MKTPCHSVGHSLHFNSMHLRVIAPSFKISDEDWARTYELLNQSQCSYAVNLPLFEEGQLCAASLDKRIKDLKESILDPKAQIIWCLRGGYGALHLLPHVQKFKKPKSIKLLIGFSDITILHYFINQNWGWPSLHYRHLNSFVKDQSVAEGLKVFRQTCKNLHASSPLVFKGLKPLNTRAKECLKKGKSMKAPIVGGNLITMQSLIGLDVPPPQKQWLFLEEIDEPIYKIDRALTQLHQSGWLKSVKGIFLGSFTHYKPEIEQDIRKYLTSGLEHLPVPVFGFLPCGHMTLQRPLFLNTSSVLSFTKTSATLTNQTFSVL